MRWRTLTGFYSLVLLSGVAFSQCEPSPAVRQVLERSYLQEDFGLTQAELDVKRANILEEGLQKHPHDFFLLRTLVMSQPDSEGAELSWAEGLHKKYPRQPVYALMHAKALVGKDTPEAIKRLETLKTSPVAAQAHLELASIYSWGKFKDKPKAQQELAAVLKLCPAPLSAPALSSISSNGTKEQVAQTAAALRRRLESDRNPLLRNSWESLWRMEFKVTPPAEHDRLRQQIARDLTRLEQSPARHRLGYMTVLMGGYESAGNKAGRDKLADEIIATFPKSSTARDLIQERWRKAHPYPQGGDKAQLEAYYRALLPVADDWHQRWPEDSLVLDQEFSALMQLPETTPEQIEKTGDELLTAYRKNPNWYGVPPLQARVAEAFLKYKVRMNDIPKLVDEGYSDLLARQAGYLNNDTYTDDSRASMQDSIAWMKLEKARVLLDYYLATRQATKAHDFDADLVAVNDAKPGNKARLLALRARIAELEGRKLDALLLYRASIQGRTWKPRPGATDPESESADRLWKELGGTEVAAGLLTERPKAAEATDSRWEKPKNPLPAAFSVSDLEGKPWKLADFKGKALLINVWATWCGPCRAEHPDFQKLYDKLKDRTDVAVLSFNVDDDLGKVAPYMKDNNFTFPVLLGREVVDAVVPSLSIPRNWFVSPQGKLEWEQIGYGPDPTWQDTMIAKLEEVLKPTAPADAMKQAGTTTPAPPPPPPPK